MVTKRTARETGSVTADDAVANQIKMVEQVLTNTLDRCKKSHSLSFYRFMSPTRVWLINLYLSSTKLDPVSNPVDHMAN